MILPSLSTRIPGGARTASLLVNTRSFPETLSTWNGAFPSVTAPLSLWPLQDSFYPVADAIGAVPLTAASNTGIATKEFQATGDPYGRYSVNFTGIACHLRASSSASYDQTTGSFSALFRFKSTGAAASGHYFARKKSLSASTNGWAVAYQSANGFLRLQFDSPSSSQTNIDVNLNFADGQYHDVLAVVDRTANEARLHTDLGSTTVSIAAHAGGSLTNTQLFGLGDTQGNLNAAARVQYSYFAFFGYAVTSTQFATIRAGG